MEMQIWQRGMEIADQLEVYAVRAEKAHKYRYAEQLRGASMSITNNIAEGSGSLSGKDFALFLTYARRSVFECANVVLFLQRRQIITEEECEKVCAELVGLSHQIFSFRKALYKNIINAA